MPEILDVPSESVGLRFAAGILYALGLPEDAAACVRRANVAQLHAWARSYGERADSANNVAVLNTDRGIVETTTLAEIAARDRLDDCDCGQIACVCATLRAHRESCRFRRAVACAVPIACDHGYDVCPTCDPCTCETAEKGTT